MMGQEERCFASYQERVSEGKALLETDEIIFRGDFRLKIPLKAITDVRADDGELSVAFDGQRATFILGRQAERWKTRILNPPSLLDKLGVKPGQTVSVLGLDDESFTAQLRQSAGRYAEAGALPDSDLIFLGAESIPDLDQLGALRHYLAPTGGVWVVFPKGLRGPGQIREADVLAAGAPAGLVDVKVARFSDTHTALKFVIPLSQR